MDLDQRVQTKREAIAHIASKHGASNLRIFGSVARGEARPDSDIDILVNLESGRSLLDHAALILELEALLGCKVDVATEKGLRDRKCDRVLQEAIPL